METRKAIVLAVAFLCVIMVMPTGIAHAYDEYGEDFVDEIGDYNTMSAADEVAALDGATYGAIEDPEDEVYTPLDMPGDSILVDFGNGIWGEWDPTPNPNLTPWLPDLSDGNLYPDEHGTWLLDDLDLNLYDPNILNPYPDPDSNAAQQELDAAAAEEAAAVEAAAAAAVALEVAALEAALAEAATLDSDGDGLFDNEDPSPYNPNIPLYIGIPGDPTVDELLDSDGEGIPDAYDPAPYDPEIWDPIPDLPIL